MPITHKLTMRIAELREISRFELAEGEDLDARVAIEIAKADEEGKLGSLATRILPSVMVTGVDEGENLSGGENVVSTALYSHAGERLTKRSLRVEPAGAGFAAIGMEDDQEDKTIGVFPDEEVARLVGTFWTAGYLPL